MSILTEQTFTNKEETRVIIDEVIQMAYESVCSTMGPNGSYVVINQLNKPKLTKDGVSVAKALDFNEARRNLIADVIKEPSIKTDLEVGDGTTTTVFLTYNLYKVFKNKMGFTQTRFVDKLVKEAVEEINKLIIPGDIYSDTFRKMLMTTSNYESEIVDKVLEIYQTHENPNIRLENCPTLPADQIVQTKEIVFPGNYGKDIFTPVHPGILNVPVEAKCPVVIVDGVVNMVIVNKLISAFTGYQSVVLFARSFEPIALSSFQSINGQGATKVIPFKVEAAGSLGSNILSELGQLLGVTPVISLDEIYDRKNVEIPSVSFLLTTQGVMFTKEDKTINERAESILSELVPRYEKMNVIDKQTPIGLSLFTRISRLRANNVTIKVTGTVPSEATERYYRYEDAMKAAKTGSIYGILPGIGWGYLTVAQTLLEKYNQMELTTEQEELVLDFTSVLTQPYLHLTGNTLENIKFLDLVTGLEEDVPTGVFDNAAATMTALTGGWACCKTLAKINNIMGRSSKSY